MRSPWSRLLSVVGGLWLPRSVWLLVAGTGSWSIGDAVDGRSSAVRLTLSTCAWLAWGTGVVTLVVPSTFGLTIVRMVGVLTCGAATLSWIGGAANTPGIAFLSCSLLFVTLVAGAELGQRCVQASAYGDERRFMLRPPAGFLLPVAIAGLLWTAAVLAAPLLLASRRWVVGSIVGLVGVLLTWFVVPRFHLLSRRWLVVVPAGIVVHDHVVLAETLMVPRRDVAEVHLALKGTEAADFTGPAAGHAIEIALTGMVTATLAPTRSAPRGTALHVRSFLVAPTRPGAFLNALR